MAQSITRSSPEELLRGHLPECIEDLEERFRAIYPKSSKGAFEARKPIADFCGVAATSVQRWFSFRGKPVGDSYIKLTCYLVMIGYKVIWQDRLSPVSRGFTELVGYGLLTAQEARDLLGYTNTASIYLVLLGKQEPGEEKRAVMRETWIKRREELEQKKADAAQRYKLNLTPQPTAEKEKPAKPTPSPRPHQTALPTDRRSTTRSRMEATIQVAKALHMLLDELGEQDIARSIYPYDQGVLLRLSARLSLLISRFLTQAGEKKSVR